MALVKYFNMPQTEDMWTYTERVLNLFKRIDGGLSGQYALVIYNTDNLVLGYVKASRTIDTVLNAYMSAPPGQHGHVPWDLAPVTTKDIHLNLHWLRKPEATADQIARLIVHEASHKWGFTTDQCYKRQTWGKADRDELDVAVELGMQQVVSRGAGAKPLYPMAKIEADNPLPVDLWLQNADSYAWTARRLWKRAGRPGSP